MMVASLPETRAMMTKSSYSVGKGKPPAHTQFKKGQSGNPGGKPKSPKSRATTSMQRRLKDAIEEAFLSDYETLRNELEYDDDDEVVEPMRRLARGFVVDGLEQREGRKILFALMEKLDKVKTDEKPDKMQSVSLTEGKAEGKAEGLLSICSARAFQSRASLR